MKLDPIDPVPVIIEWPTPVTEQTDAQLFETLQRLIRAAREVCRRPLEQSVYKDNAIFICVKCGQQLEAVESQHTGLCPITQAELALGELRVRR